MQCDLRLDALQAWLTQQPNIKATSFQLISGDASFRRYFRGQNQHGQNLIAVDAPPTTENNPLFVALAKALADAKVNTPQVLATNYDQGFMLLSDLGSQHIADIITPDNAEHLYTLCLATLAKLHSVSRSSEGQIAHYNRELIEFELAIFNDWLITKHLDIQLDQHEQQLIKNTFSYLTQIFEKQPTGFVHRDFHSRNIMLTDPKPNSVDDIALIDFQGALIGPVVYDVVSLLRDCYLKWPDDLVLKLSENYRQAHFPDITPKLWQQGFDLVGMQRHLKAAGIFARLHHRDSKSHYLADIPRTLSYVVDVAGQYSQLQAFSEWLQQKVLPRIEQANMEYTR
ncbi:serine/threonine protein kinase [Saccharobesus litoralis]|uniref:Serine/threonine protein kinase n=1 Tax=Saccharobesus litoralis TaxID=2172099 RepID=A0A2S0VRQ0_9ALTE|nr:phosphotransferase [Saccharobesus litoralis]AWB66887.1 serine/threonine protein kinase [Saccharobesus litoralis]